MTGIRARLRDLAVTGGAALLGGAVTWAVMRGHDHLDDAISAAYRCDQLRREADARDSAARLLQALLAGRTLPELTSTLAAAGLWASVFEKTDHSLIVIVIGAGAATAALTIEMRPGAAGPAVLPLPGSPPCRATATPGG